MLIDDGLLVQEGGRWVAGGSLRASAYRQGFTPSWRRVSNV